MTSTTEPTPDCRNL